MRILGPDWPSTRALKEALVEVEGTLHWGDTHLDGLEQLETLKAAGVNCPTFTTSLDEAKKWVREGKEVWGRKRQHTQGRDIVGANFSATEPTLTTRTEMRWIVTRKGNRVQRPREVPVNQVGERWNPAWCRREFWVQVIKAKNEYRQHIYKNKAIRRGKKIQITEGPNPLPVRSRRNGWHLDYGPFDSPEGLREISKLATKALNYSHAAVDVLEGMDGKLYVLECNQAPALTDENTLAAYVKAIKEMGV